MHPFVSSLSVRGRLAPSPTGHLHLGNAWSFLLCWLAVRSQGGRVVLRLEDIDPDRARPTYASTIMRDLSWLGLDWDEGPDLGGPSGPYTQSERLDRYAEVMEILSRQGRTYPCYCTRRELKSMASAPTPGMWGPFIPGPACIFPRRSAPNVKPRGARLPCVCTAAARRHFTT